MQIEELLTKYMEGETSAAEEQQLRAFFAKGNIPAEWEVYRSLFAYVDEEIAKGKEEVTSKPIVRQLTQARKVLYFLSGAAACLLLLLGLNYWINPTSPRYCSGNYVVINGRCVTDKQKVRKMAFEALREVATPAEDYLPKADPEASDRTIIEDQLKELGTLFRNE